MNRVVASVANQRIERLAVIDRHDKSREPFIIHGAHSSANGRSSFKCFFPMSVGCSPLLSFAHLTDLCGATRAKISPAQCSPAWSPSVIIQTQPFSDTSETINSACTSLQADPITATTFTIPVCLSHQTPANPSTTIKSSTGFQKLLPAYRRNDLRNS